MSVYYENDREYTKIDSEPKKNFRLTNKLRFFYQNLYISMYQSFLEKFVSRIFIKYSGGKPQNILYMIKWLIENNKNQDCISNNINLHKRLKLISNNEKYTYG